MKILNAEKILKENNFSFVAVKGDEIYTSKKRGISPVIEIIDENRDFLNGATVADRVIGKAAAMLLSKYGVAEIFAVLTSDKAIEYLKNKNVKFSYDSKAEYIINRDRTDMCPMEKTVIGTDDENLAETLIREKLQQLKNCT